MELDITNVADEMWLRHRFSIIGRSPVPIQGRVAYFLRLCWPILILTKPRVQVVTGLPSPCGEQDCASDCRWQNVKKFRHENELRFGRVQPNCWLRTAIWLNPTKPQLIFMPKFLHILSLLKGVKSVLGPSLALLAKDSFQKVHGISGIRTSNPLHVRQSCYPLGYAASCWVPTNSDEGVSTCTQNQYTAA